jgi:acyl-coenzyme A thioesterase PaaI-like protein
MTDIGVSDEHDHNFAWSVPTRLGTSAELRDGAMVGDVRSLPATTVHGAMRVSAVVFFVDAVGGIAIDTDPDTWSFTSDLSVRLPAVAAPERILGRADVLRVGRRSATVAVPLTHPNGDDLGLGLEAFARVPRRDTDPPKPDIDRVMLAEVWAEVTPLDVPLREAAGLRVIDAATGVVELALRADLLNPAGALQGAMVALVAEAAAEELATATIGSPQVVTDIDIRYLAQTRRGPVQTRARFIGPPADGSIVVDIVDVTADKLVTIVTLRTHPAPLPEG